MLVMVNNTPAGVLLTMGDRRRFLIPLGWEDNPSPRYHWVERIRSDTLVIPLYGKPELPYEVERIPGSWSPHVPEKVARYNVWKPQGMFGRRPHAEPIDVVRLSQVGRGRYCLVDLDARRVQLCVEDQGRWHGCVASNNMESAYTYCGRDPYLQRFDDERREHWAYDRVPDCPECAKFKRAWVCLRVYPYEPKQEVVKKADKEAAAAAKRAKMPTAYDRLLVDDLFETPQAHKPEVVRPPIPEPEPFAELERQERDRKLESARERNQRLKLASRDRKAR